MADDRHTSFDEYIIQGEPDKRHRAENWQIAIGLQAVDGLKPSAYLIETAKKHIEGEITIEEVKARIDEYYETEEGRKQAADRTDEADKVASNITDLLAEDAFSFNPSQYAIIHRKLFSGIIKHAGEYRDVNVSKREWVLDGDSVSYTPYYMIAKTLDYEFQQERGYKTKGESNEAIVRHLACFISRIWQVHPFLEGNTRTTAIFTIKYLRKLGYRKVNNDAFKLHSWYFRNALVRANYSNAEHSVEENLVFLERFFDNLLFGAQHELKNRFCHVFWDDTAQVPHKYPTSTPQVQDKLACKNNNVSSLVVVMGNEQLSLKQLMEKLSLKDRKNFANLYLAPAIAEDFVRMLYPNSPRHPRQKYQLTDKGLMTYNAIKESK